MDAPPALALALPAVAAPPLVVVSSDVFAGDPSSGTGQLQTVTLYGGELEISGVDLNHDEAVQEAA
eukprot:8657395-Prorocentrum_lima.AAC.1